MSVKRLRHLVELPSSDKTEVLTLFKYQNHQTYLDYVRMHLSFVLDLPTEEFAPLLDTDYFKETRFTCPPLKGKETKGMLGRKPKISRSHFRTFLTEGHKSTLGPESDCHRSSRTVYMSVAS